MELKGEQQGEDHAPRQLRELPADAVIILPVRETVLFPGVILPITVGRRASIEAAQRAVKEQRQLGILMQRDSRGRRAGRRSTCTDRRHRQCCALCHDAGRLASSRLPGRATLPRASNS